MPLSITYENLEIVTALLSVAFAIVARTALKRSYRVYDKLLENKYRKINDFNIFAPGIIIVVIGSFIALSPILARLCKMKIETDVNISEQKNSKVAEKSTLEPEEKKPAVPQSSVNNGVIIQTDDKYEINRNTNVPAYSQQTAKSAEKKNIKPEKCTQSGNDRK